jgi:hypothetical protein
MSDSSNATVQLTLTDIEVGCLLMKALVRHAASSRAEPIAFEDLLTLGRTMYPKDAMLGREVPVGIGMKLFFIDAFCKANGYPNLARLAVSKTTMRPGSAYRGDWEAERRAVAGFDWSAVEEQMAVYANAARAAVPKRFKARKERPADVAWYAYFCSHREACAQLAGNDKKEIINLLMAGLDPDTALRRVLAAKTEFGDMP